MTSPLPPPGAQQGSSPYPFPLSFPSPFPNPATVSNLGPSPVPNALGQLGNTAPSPFSQLLSTDLTPNFTNFTSAPAPAASYGNGLINTFAPAGSNAGAGSKNRIGEDNLDDVVRGLEESERMIARAQEVLSEIQRLESGLFGGGERTEGMQIGLGGVPKLEVLHLEYSQLLSSLSALATSHLFGALPVPLSAAKPSTAPDPTVPLPLGQTDKSTLPTIPDLGSWAEKQAALEFNRKEAVKAGSKAIVDILRGAQGR